ncbi:MAG: hypothetical protein PVF87_09815, partial [Acidimicrobiia bacterium]
MSSRTRICLHLNSALPVDGDGPTPSLTTAAPEQVGHEYRSVGSQPLDGTNHGAHEDYTLQSTATAKASQISCMRLSPNLP